MLTYQTIITICIIEYTRWRDPPTLQASSLSSVCNLKPYSIRDFCRAAMFPPNLLLNYICREPHMSSLCCIESTESSQNVFSSVCVLSLRLLHTASLFPFFRWWGTSPVTQTSPTVDMEKRVGDHVLLALQSSLWRIWFNGGVRRPRPCMCRT